MGYNWLPRHLAFAVREGRVRSTYMSKYSKDAGALPCGHSCRHESSHAVSCYLWVLAAQQPAASHESCIRLWTALYLLSAVSCCNRDITMRGRTAQSNLCPLARNSQIGGAVEASQQLEA